MSYQIQPMQNFNPQPNHLSAAGQFLNNSHYKYDYMEIHPHNHNGFGNHVGDRVINNDFVIRHQIDNTGNLMPDSPNITTRF